MAFGTGGRCFFGFILFIEFFVATLAVCVQCFSMIVFNFFLFGKFFLCFLTFGRLTRYFVALDALLNVGPLF